jgi:hypothetical protein
MVAKPSAGYGLCLFFRGAVQTTGTTAPAGVSDAANQHEGAKDYLSPSEMTKLLDAVKAGRQDMVPDRCGEARPEDR